MNNQNHHATPLQTLEGVISGTYHNEDNGYTVARFTPKNKSYQVTIIGAMLGINVGESLRLAGQWTTHAQYGKQFQVQHYTVQLPATIEGIRKYLGSGLIKGIGPKTSSKIVDFFGLETLTVIEKQPERLLEVPSIGKKRVEKITKTWQEQLHIKEIMLFLQANQVTTSIAVKIYKQYGDAAISIVRNNPYRLAKDVYGIGFKTADQIALNMGMAHDAPQRVGAGLVYTASQATNQGHVFEIRETLISTAFPLLGVPPEACEVQLGHLLEKKELIADGEGTQIYFPPFYYAEVGIANKLQILLASPFSQLAFYRQVNWRAVFTWLDEHNAFQLSRRQKEAVYFALTKQVAILTGGPGTALLQAPSSSCSKQKGRAFY